MNRISVVSDSIPFNQLKRCQLLTSTDLSCGGFTTLSPLTLASFEARDVTLKCARLLKIGFFALCQEKQFYFIEVRIRTVHIHVQQTS